MFCNGIIIQSNNVLPYIDQQLIKTQNYRGIYSGITWPLDTMDDIDSVNISKELFHCCIQSMYRLYTLTDPELIDRYIKHCHNLNINIRCLMVESFFDNPHFDFIINPEKTAFLGYEFVATDMQSSSSYEDLCDELFSPLLGLLNGNWIFDSPQGVQQYVDFRETLERQGYEFESYYYPRIVRLSEIHLPI